MAALGRRLAALHDAGSGGRIWRDDWPAGMQLQAACIALSAFGQMNLVTPVPCRDAQQLAGAAKLVFRGGQAALAGHVASWRGMPSDQLRLTHSPVIRHLIGQQVVAVSSLLRLLGISQDSPGGEDIWAEFGSQVAMPAAVLPVTEALRFLCKQELLEGW